MFHITVTLTLVLFFPVDCEQLEVRCAHLSSVPQAKGAKGGLLGDMLNLNGFTVFFSAVSSRHCPGVGLVGRKAEML